MPRQEVFKLHPESWKSDPAEECYKLSTLDYTAPQIYTNYALFFKLPDNHKRHTAWVLKRGLEIVLSQCRQLCGVVEKHDDGELCLHKKRDSTVDLYVQWLDGAEDAGRYPAFADLEAGYFTCSSLGNLDTWCVSSMIHGQKPEAQASNRPKVSAFKASFIHGGMVFLMHHHHYSNDIMGWAGELHQLAETCAALWESTCGLDLPPWDPACLDRSRISKPGPPEDQRIDGPGQPFRHPDRRDGQQLLFHLPRSKMTELKKLASPEDGSFRISNYNAYQAYIWRIISKHKAKLYKPDLLQNLVHIVPVDLRRRFRDPAMPPRTQGNVILININTQNPLQQITAKETISTAPLSKLAWYVRQLSDSVTPEYLEAALSRIVSIRDKTTACLRQDSFPPMTAFTTDWRGTRVYEADFGFARPHAFRFPFDDAVVSGVTIYPARINDAPAGADEGNELSISLENELACELVQDPEWNRYFEFRGIDMGFSQRAWARI